jgi:carboxyl-terminal processing protease
MVGKRMWIVVILLLGTLACSSASVLAQPSPTPTALPTPEPTATLTPTPTEPPIPTPSYIPAECQAQPLATIPPATTSAQPTPIVEANPEISADEQLRVFDDLAATINRVYVYEDFNGLDWQTITDDTRSKVEGGLTTEAFYAEMSAYLISLGDEHSNFQSPVEVAASEAELAGNIDYVGIGVLAITMLDSGHVTILSVFPGSPAEQGGLKPHDSILAVDGIPLVENGRSYPQRVRGPSCSAAVLRVQSPGEAPRDVQIVRYRITSSIPIETHLVTTDDGSRIGYIFLPTFFDETVPDQVRSVLEDFGDLDGLILDNRQNGGGSSSVVEPILAHFTTGTLGHFVSRTTSRPLSVSADGIHNSQTVPLVVLVGEDTASFGEIFSGLLQDTGRAQIVGQTTLGNVEVLHGYAFEDGSQAWIAQERFDPLNSHDDWETNGIVPDVEAYASWDSFTFETDPAVAAAVKLLQGK